MSEPPLMLIACAPVDEKIRNALIAMADRFGVKFPAVTDAHTITTCHQCGAEVWIGPSQKEASRVTPGAIVLCYQCLVKSQALEADDVQVISLRPSDVGNGDRQPPPAD